MSGSVRAGRAFVEIWGDDTELKKALDRAAAKMRSFGQAISAVGKNLLAIGTAITAPIILAAKAYEKAGNDLYLMSQRTGASVEALSRLSYAAGKVGLDMDTLEKSIRKMQRTIFEAAQGSKQAEQSLGDLGLSAQNLINLSADQQMNAIAAALAKIPNPTQRATEAMKLFGRSGSTAGASMIPLLDSLAEMTKRADTLGIVISGPAAKAAAEFHVRLTDLYDVLKNSLFRAGEAVAPVLTKLTEIFTVGAIAANKWITAHKEVVVTALKVGVSIAAAGVGLIAFGKSITFVANVIRGLGAIVGLAKGAFSLMTSTLAVVLNPLGLVVAGIIGLGIYLMNTTENGQIALKSLGAWFQDLGDIATDIFGGIKNALLSGEFKLAAEIMWTGLKLEWETGVAGLELVIAELSSAVQTAMAEMWAGILKASANAIKAMKDMFVSLINAFKTVVNTLSGWFAKIMTREDNFDDVFNLKMQKQNDPIEQKYESQKQDAQKRADVRRDRVNEEFEQNIQAGHQISTFGLEDAKFLAETRDAKLAKIQQDYDAKMAVIDKEHKSSPGYKDYDKLQESIEKRHNDTNAGIDQQVNKAQADADAELKKSLDANKEQLHDRLATIDAAKGAIEKSINDELAKGIAADHANLAKLEAKLQELNNHAANVHNKHGFDLEKISWLNKPTPPDAGDMLATMGKTMGTFSARGASGLGVSSLGQRQLEEQQKTNKIVADVLAATEKTGKFLGTCMTFAN